MQTICKDAMLKICSFLPEKDRVYLTMITTTFGILRSEMLYSKKVRFDKIKDLSYFDNFESVQLLSPTDRTPKFAKFVYYEASTHDIPLNVTHLSFAEGFNESIQEIIAPTVTDLEFSWDFVQPVHDCKPATVKNVTFGYYFDKGTEEIFGVHHLIGMNHNDHQLDALPITIVHVTYRRYFYKSKIINNAPNRTWSAINSQDPPNKKCMTLSYNLDKRINDDITTLVKILIQSPSNN
uniref:F-box domain-containing protein n=1 Tax=viral metagenome TaxID=1070528 RepID=A0A6C0C7E9_9ZZZZ